jgi:hypothetical protein
MDVNELIETNRRLNRRCQRLIQSQRARRRPMNSNEKKILEEMLKRSEEQLAQLEEIQKERASQQLLDCQDKQESNQRASLVLTSRLHP